MLDLAAATIAMRARAITLSVATTGSTTLSSTSTGYARTAGSFIADGFSAGQEILPTGFPDGTRRVITTVTAQLMTIDGTLTASAPASGRTLLCGLPGLRSWENEQQITLDAKRPYVTESFVPATSRMITVPANTGTVEETGLYVISLYGLPKYGVVAIRKYMNGLAALFACGTAIAVGADTIRVRTDIGPSSSVLMPSGTWTVCSLTIPWRARTTNTVAA